MTDETKKLFIKNYGLFWKLDDIVVKKSNGLGQLIGKKKHNQNYKVNFSDQTGFYALYDDGFNLVYFGQVGKQKKTKRTLHIRLKEHHKGHLSGRWSRFSWFGIKSVNESIKDKNGFYTLDKNEPINKNEPIDKDESNSTDERSNFLNQVEAIVIAVSEPPNNRQGGSFLKAQQFFQHRDEKALGLPTEDMLRDMYKTINQK